MKKNLFLKLSMLLLALGVSVNSVWAEMTPEQAMTNGYWARLIAQPSTVTIGSGRVFVSTSIADPEDGSYKSDTSRAEGYTEVFAMTSANMDATFYAFVKPNPGSYYLGWSFTDGGTDLGDSEYLRTTISVTPSAKKKFENLREYTIYAAFEPVRIVSAEIISGSNTTAQVGDEWTCTQTIRFRAETPGAQGLRNSETDLVHFKLPTLVPKAGTSGTWTTSVSEWDYSNVVLNGDNAELTVPVTFTAPNGNAGEYGATLTLETYAGVKMSVYLYARTIVAGDQAIRYNKSKVQQEAGGLTTLLANAAEDDIIKLNGNYSDPVSINKKITFDLNGYNLSNTITVSGSEVTLAYSPYGGSANALIVSGGKAVLNGGTLGMLTISSSATVEQNGAMITGPTNNNGTLTTTDGIFRGELTSSNTLTINGGTFNNTSGAAVTITGGTAQIKKGTISGLTYGVQTTGGATTIEKLASITGETKALYGHGGTLTVNNGKFTDPADLIAGTVTFHAGYFQTNSAGGATALGKQVWRNTAGAEYREGYAFFVGDQTAAQASNVSVCRIGKAAYASLEDALTYANNNPAQTLIIFMENDYTLSAGYYTIPENATLVVPKENDQEVAYPVINHKSAEGSYPTPYAFRTLTFADGVNMNVLGALEVSCAQYCKTGSAEQAIPGGSYGHLVLKPGSHITINNGGELRAWGYVTGDGTRAADGTYLSGEIDARRGSIVREQFQIGDWKGGDISLTMIMDQAPQNKTHLFPVYMYFIQNVESPVKYHPGSALFCATAVDVQGLTAYANEIKVVGVTGEPAMFLMDQMADAENTWVRKWYDANKDQQVYEVNSGAQLGSMVIDLGEVPKTFIQPGEPGTFLIQMDSRKFILPLTSNMKIHLLTGNMQFTQSTACLPGMEVEIDKESTISITNQNREGVVEGALYFYDSDQWGRYVQSGKYGTIVHYSATLDAKPEARSVDTPDEIGDAVLNVHGTFQVGGNCAVYTTVGKMEGPSGTYNQDLSSGGASIISTNEDAGTFVFAASAAPVAEGQSIADGSFVYNDQGNLNPEVLVNYDNSSNGISVGTALHPETPKHIYGFELCVSALLKNGVGAEYEFAETEGTEEGESYCYINNQWTLMEVDEDNSCFMVDNYGTFYAKPADYVAIVGTKITPDPSTPDYKVIVGNEDHTYSDKAGAGRLFILTDGCQWWEVENVDNLYHCVHPLNDTYYYWVDDPDEEDPYFGEWKEKKFTITWKNWDGSEIKSYDYGNLDGDGNPTEIEYRVTYGTMAEYLGSNPTREENIDYTYDFTGWQPALGPVTQDVTYTATYVEQPRKYTIIFQQEGGEEIERHFLTHNEMPACENVPTRTGFTLQWEPAIAAVTGDATYRATWLEEPPTEYAITFFDYDGTTKLKPTDETPYMVAVGAMPIAPANPANKPATNEFTYVFDHWSPALEEVSLTSAKSYTAVYREVAKTYTVIFQDEDGSEIERHDYPYGATPACSATPTKANTAQYTYSFAWTPNIQTVQGAATYRAVFTPTTNRYTVTLRSTNDDVCTFGGAGVYDYNTPITISIMLNTDAEVPYEFLGWEELEDDMRTSIDLVVTENITLTAKVVREDIADLPDLEIGIFDAPVVPNVGTTFNFNNLILVSDGENSAQLLGHIENVKIWGDAFFLMDMPFDANKWYAIAVPWRVKVGEGIMIDDVILRPNVDFYLVSYDGAMRAAQGPVDACWKFASGSEILQPGEFYMIYMVADADYLLFKKMNHAPLQTTQLTVHAHPQATGNEVDAGWNGIANPSLYHAYLNASANTVNPGSLPNFGQIYIADETRYETIDMTADPLIVGGPVFVQVPADKTVVAYADPDDAYPSPAPRRLRKAYVDDSYYEVQISSGEQYTDRIYLLTQEDKEDRYVIGLDLAKAGVSATVAQMWVNRYNTKLSVNTTAPVGKTATYPLGISVPQAGEYQIYPATDLASNQEMYVTYEGRAIWNLAYGPYVVDLPAGTHTKYGLKLIQRESPAIVTGVEQTTIEDQSVRKVLIDNTIYIIREGAVYTINGQKVK